MSALLIAGVPRSGTTWIGRALGHTDDTVYVNEPDGFRDPFAFRVMLARGENPILTPGDGAPDVERLWAGALAGGRPAGTVRDRLARTLYDRTPLDERREARAAGGAGARLRLAARLAVPRVAAPGRPAAATGPSRTPEPNDEGAESFRPVVVKSVMSALCLEWITDRFRPRVLVVERNPFNVLASWNELGYVRNARETAALIVHARYRWGVEPPPADAPHLALQAFVFAVLTSALRDAAERHRDWGRARHEDLCVDTQVRFPALAAELGLVWGDEAARFVAESDAEGTPYRTQRRTEEQPDRWRERLDAEQVATIREVLGRFPAVLVPEP
jgi:hypothetical protein